MDMKKHSQYAIIGLQALQRAARKVADDARKNQYKIPVWKNNRIEYEIPGIVHEQPVICEMAKDVPENYPSEKASDSN